MVGSILGVAIQASEVCEGGTVHFMEGLSPDNDGGPGNHPEYHAFDQELGTAEKDISILIN